MSTRAGDVLGPLRAHTPLSSYMPSPLVQPRPVRALSTSSVAQSQPQQHPIQTMMAAAMALHSVLDANEIPHAFAGSLYAAILTGSPVCDDIACTVQRGDQGLHAFRRVLSALSATPTPDLVAVNMPWASQLKIRYGSIEIDILPGGEYGPRTLDTCTVQPQHGIPFLSPTEFVRAKLRSWSMTGSTRDAADAAAVLVRCAEWIDPGRVDTAEVKALAAVHGEVIPAWTAVRRRRRGS